MASRILHLAVSEIIIDRVSIHDKNRFRLGTLLPDAYRTGVPKADSHLKIKICGGSKKTYDLQRFQNLFGEEEKKDELYLGYYLHLIQDLVFRRLVYEKYKWNPRIPGNVERLWNDYKMINPYVISNYSLKNELTIPGDFSSEKINQLYPFDVDKLCSDLSDDFEEADRLQKEPAFFFSDEMASEFIESAAEVCISEIKAIRSGERTLFLNDYVWWDLRPSLLNSTQNTRDLGGYPTQDGKMTKWGSVFRSDAAYSLDENDISVLKDKGITTVIDMRTEKTKNEKPSAFSKLNFIDYHYIEIFEGGLPESADKVATHYMVKIAENKNMALVFKTIASAKGTVLYHCTAGKDRTGVVSAILLCHAGVEDKDVIENYVLSREYAKERIEAIHHNFPDIDMNVVIPREDFMREFLRLFREKYISTERYFKEIGLTDVEIAQITEKIINQ